MLNVEMNLNSVCRGTPRITLWYTGVNYGIYFHNYPVLYPFV